MRTIKVFIASSEELKPERLEFSDMILEINKIFKSYGIQIEPEKWEHLDSSMGPLHKQQEYNNVLKTCEICLVLYWTRFGEYTKSELDTAYTELCAGRNPNKIYVYFKDTDSITPELQQFKDSFTTEYGHFFCHFENVDTLRLRFLLQLMLYLRDKTLSDDFITVNDSKVIVNGRVFTDLNHIPFAINNQRYQSLVREVEKLNARIAKYPDDTEMRQDFLDKQEELNKMSLNLIQTAKRITEISSDRASARLEEAMRLFENGDNDGANAVLNLKDISSDTEDNVKYFDVAHEALENARKSLEININELLLKANILQNGMKEGWYEEVNMIYDMAICSARNRIDGKKFAIILAEYADFLTFYGDYHSSETLYSESLSIFEKLYKDNLLEEKGWDAIILNRLAGHHARLKLYDRAESEYKQALDIATDALLGEVMLSSLHGLAGLSKQKEDYDLAKEHYETAIQIRRTIFTDEYDLAILLNDLADLEARYHNYKEAETYYLESLEILRRVAGSSPMRQQNLAITLCNMANLYRNYPNDEKSRWHYIEAANILRHLAKRDPSVYEPLLAIVLNNMASSYHHRNWLHQAEQLYDEALLIQRRLVSEAPDIHEEDMATTIGNLAMVHDDMKKYEKAEAEYNEAIGIFRRLAKDSPNVFNLSLSFKLNGIACLHENMGHNEKAEEEFNESLEIRSRLAEMDPKANLPHLATLLSNIAMFHKNIGEVDKARSEAQKALNIYINLSKGYPQIYGQDVLEINEFLNSLDNV